MSVRSILASAFLVDARAEQLPGPARAAAQTVAVIAAADQLIAAARVVAAASVMQPDSGTALIGLWGAAGPVPERLGRGRVVALPEDPAAVEDAVSAACRVASPGPLIVGLGGLRPPVLDQLVARADAVIVACAAPTDRALAALAFQRARGPGQAGGVVYLPQGVRSAALRRGAGGGRIVRDVAALLQHPPFQHEMPTGPEAQRAIAQAAG